MNQNTLKKELRQVVAAGLTGQQMPVFKRKVITRPQLINLLKGSGYSVDELRDIVNDIIKQK